MFNSLRFKTKLRNCPISMPTTIWAWRVPKVFTYENNEKCGFVAKNEVFSNAGLMRSPQTRMFAKKSQQITHAMQEHKVIATYFYSLKNIHIKGLELQQLLVFIWITHSVLKIGIDATGIQIRSKTNDFFLTHQWYQLEEIKPIKPLMI